MNQILSVEMSNNKKNKRKASIRSVVIFFCMILLVFGISIIGVGVFSNIENTSEEVSNIIEEPSGDKPKIEIVQGKSSLNVNVSSTNKIAKVVYKWNNEAETQVNGNNENDMSLEIKVPIGTNILSIIATDENGVEQAFEKEYVGVEIYEPTITLGQDGNTIKIICDSEDNIDYISYYFDETEQKTEQINNVSAEISMNVIEGEHTLTVIVVNDKGEKYEDTKSIYIPTVKIVTDGEYFIINAEDSRSISKVNITFNDKEEDEKEINNTTYEEKIKLQNGENKIIVKVTNSDGLSITKRVRYEK